MREPWIKPRKRIDLSSMGCCQEAEERARLLVAMGCIICRWTPQIHHLRDGVGLGMRSPWWRTIPLCPKHHDSSPYSTHGRDRGLFHRDHGSEAELLERVNARLPGRLTGPAAQ